MSPETPFVSMCIFTRGCSVTREAGGRREREREGEREREREREVHALLAATLK